MDKRKIITELIVRIKAFEKEAFSELIELTQMELIKTAYLYLKDKMLAEDVVNDTYIKLIEKCRSLKNDNIMGWLKTVVINKSIDLLKKRRRETLINDEILNLKSLSHDEVNNIIVRECLANLDDKERKALLFDAYDYRLKEIANQLDLTIKQVRTLLKNAKKRFKESYKDMNK